MANNNETPENEIQDQAKRIFRIVKGQEGLVLYEGKRKEISNEVSVVVPAVIDGEHVDRLDSPFRNCKRLKKVVIEEGIRIIGSSAFSGCSELESVEIPDSVELIDDRAFFQALSLKKIFIPKSVERIERFAFYDCPAEIEVDPANKKFSSENGVLFNKTKRKLIHFPGSSPIQDYVIPNSVREIDEAAFRNCKGLVNVVMPEGLKRIGDWAFEECSSLSKIVVPCGVKKLGIDVFSGCSSLVEVVLSEGLEELSSAFSKCASLTEITLPDSIIDLGGAFEGCTGLTELVIPKGVKRIGGVVKGCVNLKKIVIPDSVELIYRDTFTNCKSLSEIFIPKSVNVMYDLFERCPARINVDPENQRFSSESGVLFDKKKEKLIRYVDQESVQTYVVPNSVKVIGEDAFRDAKALTDVVISDGVREIEHGAFYNCSNLKRVHIPASVRTIGVGAFGGCSSLTDVVISGDVKTIYSGTFSECVSLTNVVLPKSLKAIDDEAFSQCSALSSVTIPEGVQKIGLRAFFECPALTKVVIPPSVTSIGPTSFWRSPITFHVYQGSYAEEWARKQKSPIEIIGQASDWNAAGSTNGSDQNSPPDPSEIYETEEVPGGVAIVKVIGVELLDDGPIVIPSVISGKRVVELGAKVFSGYSDVPGVVIPEGVERIGSEAFSCCDCENFSFPESLREIGEEAFNLCDIKNPVLPQGLRAIGKRAFYESGSLEVIRIPKGVEEIGEAAFSATEAAIELDPENPYFTLDKGILFDKKMEKLLYCPHVKPDNPIQNYVIPSSVREICDGAFELSWLQSIVIPEGVKRIGNEAFRCSYVLEQIVIPRSVEEIGEDPFYDCGADVLVYKGSYAEEWAYKDAFKFDIIETDEDAADR